MLIKRYLALAIASLLGAAIGLIACWIYFQSSVKEATTVSLEVLAASLYAYEVNEAESQFSSHNRDVAIYALDRAVRHLNSFQAPRYVTCRKTAYSLGKFNIRLARLYHEAGNTQARLEHLQQAMESYENMGWKLESIDQLQKALPLIESDKLSEAIKTYGELITPCDVK